MGRRSEGLRAGILTAVVALLAGVAAGVAPAGAATFTLSGAVTDNSSTPVVDVVVDVLDPATGGTSRRARRTEAVTTRSRWRRGRTTCDSRHLPVAVSSRPPSQGEAVDADTVLDVVLPPTPPPAPGATVVAPKNGQTVSGTYDLAATTTGPADRVEFYIDDVLIGQATARSGLELPLELDHRRRGRPQDSGQGVLGQPIGLWSGRPVQRQAVSARTDHRSGVRPRTSPRAIG